MTSKKIRRVTSVTPKRKKSKVIWILALVAVLVLSSAFYIFYLASREMVPVFEVKVEVEGALKNPVIARISYEHKEVPLTEEPPESGSNIPGIYVIAYGSKSEEGYFQPYTEWTSKEYDGAGTYILQAPFQFDPDEGEFLKIQVKIVDINGKTIALKEFKIIWGFKVTLEATCNVVPINDTYIINEPKLKKVWVNPDSIESTGTEHLPGIYFTVENDKDQINYINSEPLTNMTEYTIRVYFQEKPVIGETLKLFIVIKNSGGDEISRYPENDRLWTFTWI